jgi:hypothetical protein
MEELTAEETTCDQSSARGASLHGGLHASESPLGRLLRCLEGLPVALHISDVGLRM